MQSAMRSALGVAGLCLSLGLREHSVVVTSPLYLKRNKHCLRQQGCMGKYRSVDFGVMEWASQWKTLYK